MTSLTLTPPAYALLTLHAARYPHATVVGLLVGDAATSTVNHVVPLAHHWTSLAPAQDIAVDLAATHAANASGKGQLLGVYEAPAVASVDEPSAAAVRLAGKVAQAASKVGSSSSSSSAASSTSHIVVVQGSKLLSGDSADSTTHGLVPYTLPASASASGMARPKKSGDASGSGVTVQGGAKTLEAVKRLVRGADGADAAEGGGAWKGLRDFDDHLEDTAADWLDNASLIQSMAAAGVSA